MHDCLLCVFKQIEEVVHSMGGIGGGKDICREGGWMRGEVHKRLETMAAG